MAKLMTIVCGLTLSFLEVRVYCGRLIWIPLVAGGLIFESFDSEFCDDLLEDIDLFVQLLLLLFILLDLYPWSYLQDLLIDQAGNQFAIFTLILRSI